MSAVSRGRRRATGAGTDGMRWVTSAALFAPLILILLVTARTWSAERRYAVLTHKVIQDYAGIAAWQYARRANMMLHEEAMHAFGGISKGHQRTGMIERLESPQAILSGRGKHRSAFLDHARFAFTYEAHQGRLESAGGAIDGETRMMLERRLGGIARNARGDAEPHHVLFDSTGGPALAIAVWSVASPDGPIRGVYGVVSDSRGLLAKFRDIIGDANLLPATRSTEPLDESNIAVRLSRSDGAVVFASARSPGATASTDSATLQQGQLRTTVDLSPRLANALLVGGAPPSQLPSLALMIIVASVLAGIGLVHERRTRELARLRGRFIANVSHELRTPLAQISMFAETLALGRERNAIEGKHFASIIFAEARRLTGLVESVLRFSRLESRHETFRGELVDVAREVADAVESFAPVARASEVTITTELSAEAYAQLDRASFRQIVLNLLDNAVKHGGRGTSVQITLTESVKEIVMTVDDSGPGVPEAWRGRIFEPFVRADDAKAAGAGIGLAVVRDLVITHGGSVTVDRSPGGGARFVVAVPAASSPDPVEPAEAVVTPG